MAWVGVEELVRCGARPVVPTHWEKSHVLDSGRLCSQPSLQFLLFDVLNCYLEN